MTLESRRPPTCRRTIEVQDAQITFDVLPKLCHTLDNYNKDLVSAVLTSLPFAIMLLSVTLYICLYSP